MYGCWLVEAGSDTPRKDDNAAERLDPRASIISQALRQIARKARQSELSLAPIVATNRRWQKALIPGVIAAFVVVVLIPVVISAIYLAFFAADQYAAEARFAVRGGNSNIIDAVASGAGTAAAGAMVMQHAQDTMIVYNYVQSRGIVEDLNKSLNLREIFSREQADYVWRFNPKRPIESLVGYWRRRATVNIDPSSGIISVVVTAFTPQDTLDIANGVATNSEKLVNELSDRSRRDALKQAQAELNLAQANLQERSKALRDLRNSERIVDPAQAAAALGKMQTDLRLELISLEQEYTVIQRSVSRTAPQMQVLQARITSMREQIAKLADETTRRSADIFSSPSDRPVSESMSRFDLQTLELTIAQQQYQSAMTAFERARISIVTQEVYLATFLQPILPEYPLYPQRLWIWSVILSVSLLLWVSGIGLAVLVRNHIAI